MILPVSTYVERSSTYLNMEGRFRFSKIAVFSKCYSDWEVFQIFGIFSKKISSIGFFFEVLLNLSSFFYIFVNYNCIFFYNSKMFLNRLFFISGFFFGLNYDKLSISFFVPLLTKYVLNFFYLKFFNIIFFRLVNNYYTLDFYCKNSKILSLNSMKSYNVSFVNL